ncbi:MAG: hypothetical protein FJ149_00925 [Euryarchaeota archaeon]|nr:hypothetical protein [Euryarchaeota archaeon]
MSEKERGSRPRPLPTDGTPYHLVEIYAHNTIHELILKVRQDIAKERGRFTLPTDFIDHLEVDCGKWILEKGATEAERLARGRITAFLDERQRHKREEDERKAKLSLRRE